MNRRLSLILILLSALAATWYNVGLLKKKAEYSVPAVAKVPTMEPEPLLGSAMPAKSDLASVELWNFNPGGALPNLKELFKPFYSLSRSGHFDSLQRSDRPQEQWEFQGVLVRGATYRALFYNTAAKRLRNVGSGEKLDEQLKVVAVAAAAVTLETKGEKKPIRYKLQIFNSNRDLYAKKRKMP